MIFAFPAADMTDDQCISLSNQISFRNKFNDIARVPLMNIKLIFKTLDRSIHDACFVETEVMKHNVERTVELMATERISDNSANVLAKHYCVMSNLLHATINNDYEHHCIASISNFLQNTSQILQSIFICVTKSSENNRVFDPSIITKNKGTCRQIRHLIQFLRESIMFEPGNKVSESFTEIITVLDLIIEAPFN